MNLMRVRGMSLPSLAVSALVLLASLHPGTGAFTLSSAQRGSSLVKSTRPAPSVIATAAADDTSSASASSELKDDLLKRIQTLRVIKERDGDFSVDFGVKGGELDKKSRAPQKVDYYSISDDAGRAAEAVIETAKSLANENPTEEPTLYLGDKDRGGEAPLNGEWKLLFTTAADATFSKNSTRGYATAKNVVDAARGRITNIVDFADKNGTEPVLKQLNVVIAANADGRSRVELRFRYARAVLTKFLWWKCRWSLYIPVPAPFITRLIVLFSRIFRFGRKEKRVPPKAFFDVLYLDEQLRIHRTGEDNLFVQAKDTWEKAKPLLT